MRYRSPSTTPPDSAPRTSVVNMCSDPSTSSATAIVSSFWLLAGINGAVAFVELTARPSTATATQPRPDTLSTTGWRSLRKALSDRSRCAVIGTRRDDSSGTAGGATASVAALGAGVGGDAAASSHRQTANNKNAIAAATMPT